MPFKSQAQRRKFAELLVHGKISPETFEEWNRETGGKKLPDHVRSAKRKPRPATSRTTRKPRAGSTRTTAKRKSVHRKRAQGKRTKR